MFPLAARRTLSAQEKVSAEWDSMAGEWDDLAAGYAQGFFDSAFQQAGINQSSSECSQLRVLDFGCGTGLLTDKLRRTCREVIAIDASSQMMELLQEKVRSEEWDNVKAYHVVLANLDNNNNKHENESIQRDLEKLYGQIDIIFASSVLTFIPEEDVPKTMFELGKLLKPNTGLLVHSDWPLSATKHPDGMTTEVAVKLYEHANLQPQSMDIVSMNMGNEQHGDVFFGVAKKT